MLGYGATDNRLTGITTNGSASRTLTHDAAGNIATDTRGATVYVYNYNAANRLQTVTVGGVLTGTYSYNALQQLAIRTLTNVAPSGTIHAIYDLAGHLIAETDGAGATVREYVWLEDRPLAVVDGVNTASPAIYFVHVDHHD